MARKMDISGTEEWMQRLRSLGSEAENIAKMALFDGAGVVAEAVRKATNSLPSGTTGEIVNGHPVMASISANDRADLAAGIGIAKFQSDGDTVDTSISFNGYARRKEKNFPNGVPLAMLARSIESGSSMRAKHPFVRKAANAAKSAALAAAIERGDQEIERIGGN